ncbi:MAG: cytochrome c3 family protein [Gammaproteobacteria bacterium]|nr:cytochrome c3 family protein [Gammaproteobacteria bacterium]
MTGAIRHILLTASSLLLLVWVGSASAQTIVGSQHDLTVGGNAQGSTNNTDEVCVFCHTPHGSDIAAPVPLWNKVLGAPGSYTQYSTLQTPTFDSTEAPVGSVSLACLSCHDGTQAMDVVLNSPGSGGYNAAGNQIDQVAIGNMVGTPVPMLGTDLTNDHPVSMQYGGGGATAADPPGAFAGTLGDPDFRAPIRADVNGNPVWWVDSPVGTALTRESTDMILYARPDLGAVQPFVECGSCHDPHNSASQGPTSVAFLRINNTASQICTTCHTK